MDEKAFMCSEPLLDINDKKKKYVFISTIFKTQVALLEKIMWSFVTKVKLRQLCVKAGT